MCSWLGLSSPLWGSPDTHGARGWGKDQSPPTGCPSLRSVLGAGVSLAQRHRTEWPLCTRWPGEVIRWRVGRATGSKSVVKTTGRVSHPDISYGPIWEISLFIHMYHIRLCKCLCITCICMCKCITHTFSYIEVCIHMHTNNLNNLITTSKLA